MSTWVIVSWVGVAVMTAVNVVIFVKLKHASEQMMKSAFPNAKNLNEAVSQMQQMMGGMKGARGNPFGAMGGRAPGVAGAGNKDAQLRAAMEMLKNLQQPKGKR